MITRENGPAAQSTTRKTSARPTTALMFAGLAALATNAAASGTPATGTPATGTTSTTPTATAARLVEWDFSPLEDMVPGALAVDDRSSSKNSKVWFVTRIGNNAKLYRFSPGLDMRKHKASSKAWDLGALLTGGAKLRHSDDGRFAFVNVTAEANTFNGALVAIDTRDDSRITWVDRPFSDQVSDVAVDTRGGYVTVFTAAPSYDSSDFATANGVVQRLRPGTPQLMNGAWVVPAEVTRFPIGGGAGTCDDTPGSAASPCVPGITVDRRRGNPVYVSEPTFSTDASGNIVSAIGEIDPTPTRCPSDGTMTCVRVRHWPLPVAMGAPRQIRVDDMGRIWGITSKGEIFSFEITRNCDRAVITRHDPLGPVGEEYLFAVAPAGGVIGFTDTNNNKVSALFPESTVVNSTAVIAYIKPIKKTVYGSRVCITPVNALIDPRVADATGVTYRTPGDGTYIETDISTGMAQSGSPVPSMSPTGMEADGTWKTGAFYYGVAVSGGSNRIGHLEVPINKHRDMDCRKGDNDRDHDGTDDDHDDDVDGDNVPNTLDADGDNDGIADAIDVDKNGDGIEDAYQTPGQRETKRSDHGSLAPGETRDYEMEYDAHSISLLTVFEAASTTAPVSIQVLDDDGMVILSSLPALGKAVATALPALPGVYTVRVKNAGPLPITYNTTIIGKQVPY